MIAVITPLTVIFLHFFVLMVGFWETKVSRD